MTLQYFLEYEHFVKKIEHSLIDPISKFLITAVSVIMVCYLCHCVYYNKCKLNMI